MDGRRREVEKEDCVHRCEEERRRTASVWQGVSWIVSWIRASTYSEYFYWINERGISAE